MISQKQLSIIQDQLGRKPRGIVDVAHVSETGVPVVLQMRSLVDQQPFPTLYWLCSKDLHRAIARLETEGWVRQLEDVLQQDEGLLRQYRQNHQDYVEKRWRLMAEDDRLAIERCGFTALFQQYGIGGIRQWDTVRCLHMHYAHYLCAGPGELKNVIGERLEQQFGLSELELKI